MNDEALKIEREHVRIEDAKLRLECLKLALAHRTVDTRDPLDRAREYYEYISGDLRKQPGGQAGKTARAASRNKASKSPA